MLQKSMGTLRYMARRSEALDHAVCQHKQQGCYLQGCFSFAGKPCSDALFHGRQLGFAGQIMW